ncbi:MAG: hypothetical protein AAB360_02745 [Patescibacteria group bacterium]
MAKTIDRVLDEVKPKASQIGDLAMHGALKSGLSAEDLQRVIERGGEFQDAIQPILWRLGAAVTLVDSDLLQPVTFVPVEGTESFKAGEHFKRGTTDSVVIGYVGSNFEAAFGGKVETNIPKANLRIHRLRQSSIDAPIIAGLGGEAQVENQPGPPLGAAEAPGPRAGRCPAHQRVGEHLLHPRLERDPLGGLLLLVLRRRLLVRRSQSGHVSVQVGRWLPGRLPLILSALSLVLWRSESLTLSAAKRRSTQVALPSSLWRVAEGPPFLLM